MAYETQSSFFPVKGLILVGTKAFWDSRQTVRMFILQSNDLLHSNFWKEGLPFRKKCLDILNYRRRGTGFFGPFLPMIVSLTKAESQLPVTFQSI